MDTDDHSGVGGGSGDTGIQAGVGGGGRYVARLGDGAAAVSVSAWAMAKKVASRRGRSTGSGGLMSIEYILCLDGYGSMDAHWLASGDSSCRSLS